MPVLVTCKFDEDRIKTEGVSMETSFSPIKSQWEISVNMATTVLMELVPKPKNSLSSIPLIIHIKFDQDWPTDLEDSIMSLLKFNSPSRVSNSEVNGPIRPEFEFVREFMHVLVSSNFDEDPIKMNEKAWRRGFPIIWEMF